MAADSGRRTGSVGLPPSGDDCPLPVGKQRKNIALFGALWSLYYLCAPVSYVGVTHANLLKELGCNDKIANLPNAGYQWMTALPILVIWFFPQPRVTKPLLVGSLATMGAMSGAVALAMWFHVPKALWTALVVLHGLVFGVGNGLAIPLLWEIVRRGISSARRGRVLGLAFGAGSLFALAGSVTQQFMLSGRAHGLTISHVSFPGNYAMLFAGATPILLLAALLSTAFSIPVADAFDAPLIDEATVSSRGNEIRQGLKDFIASPSVRWGAIVYALVYASGSAIMATVSIIGNATMVETGRTLGYQNELRFGFKAVAGALLGWLLARTHPRTPLIATTATLVVALFWALSTTGPWYLMSMGLLGAGELFGVYFPNYIASASPKSRVRLNMAYLNLIGALAGFAPLVFGAISDQFDRRASLYTAAGVLVATLLLIFSVLPADPRPPEERALTASDRRAATSS